MDRLKIAISGEPPCFVTVECEAGERARQIARWLLNQQSEGLIPHQQSSKFVDEGVAGPPKGRGQTVAARVAQLRSKKKGGAAGSAATALRKRS